MMMAPKLGVKIRYCCPEENQPNQDIMNICDLNMITKCTSPEKAVETASIVYTDVWSSMGFEGKTNEDNFKTLQVNEQIMSLAKKEAIFMHCMPMNRGKEVSHSLPDRHCSVIFDQSENRLHVQKALLLFYG